MNASRYIQKLAAVTFVLLAGLCVRPSALANIYTYTGNDGTVNLSNVPADDHYTMLIPGPAERSVAAGRLPSSIAGKAQYDGVVEEIARTYGLDSALLHAVISVESQYRPNAVSRKGRRA